MKELRCGHQNVTRAHQIIIGDDRSIAGVMQETVARYHRCVARVRLLPRMLMLTLLEILGGMRIRIIVHIAEVDLELVVALLDHRMHDLNPLRFALLDGVRCGPIADGRRPTEELTVPRCRRCEYDAGHEPGGRDFGEENQHNGAQLPASEFAGDAADDVDLFHGFGCEERRRRR